MNSEYTLRGSERFTRLVLGSCLVLSIFVLPLNPSLIALINLIAFYPLLTALIAIDPYYLLIDHILNYISKNAIFPTPSHA